jgi:hypothetical protein
MTAYRLYFLDAKGGIHARQDFVADGDPEALTLGRLLWQACADCYQGYELWEGARRLAREETSERVAPAPPSAERIAPHLQERLLALQEILLGSHWRAAKSAALLIATQNLRRSLAANSAATLTYQDMMRYIGAATGSSMMSLQIAEGTGLRLRGSHGFDRLFDYFAVVERDDCACGAAFTNRRQTVVPAIGSSPIYAGQQSLVVLRERGVASCVSTPFLGRDGSVTGMFSILRRDIWHPADGELAQLQHIANDISTAMADPLSAVAQRLRSAV